jgi:hypothetical protein
VGRSQFGRLKKKPSILSTQCSPLFLIAKVQSKDDIPKRRFLFRMWQQAYEEENAVLYKEDDVIHPGEKEDDAEDDTRPSPEIFKKKFKPPTVVSVKHIITILRVC